MLSYQMELKKMHNYVNMNWLQHVLGEERQIKIMFVGLEKFKSVDKICITPNTSF
jgi:hypothetical protein